MGVLCHPHAAEQAAPLRRQAMRCQFSSVVVKNMCRRFSGLFALLWAGALLAAQTQPAAAAGGAASDLADLAECVRCGTLSVRAPSGQFPPSAAAAAGAAANHPSPPHTLQGAGHRGH